MKHLCIWLLASAASIGLAALAASEAPDLQPQPQSAKERGAIKACGLNAEPYWEGDSSHLCLRRVDSTYVVGRTL